MDSQKCTKHPSQPLRYVCVTCGNALLCRDCKTARHASHEARDVRAVSDELRRKAQEARTDLDERLDYLRQLRASVEEHIASFEAQVEKAEREMENRRQAVVEWALRHCNVAQRRVQELKREGMQELRAVLVELDAADDSLRSLKHNAVAVARGSRSDSAVVTLAAGTNFDAGLSKSQLSALVPQNTFRLVTRAASPDRCQREIELYIGEPELAEVGTTANLLPMCAVPRFNCSSSSSDSPCQVMAILPMQSGAISVAYQDDKDAKEGFMQVAIFTKEGHRQFRGSTRMQQVSQMVELSPNRLMLLAAGNCSVCKVVSFGTEAGADSPLKNDGAFCMMEHNGITSACALKLQNHRDIEAGQLPALTPVMALDVPDPLVMAANKDGRYFVVLTESRRIVLYQRDNPVALWKSSIDYELKNLSPTAVCFYVVDKAERLLVADFRYNSVLVVDYLDGGKIVTAFHSPRPSPSALAVDGSGFLWVGCQSGEVVSCFPLSSVQDQGRDDFPTDEGGYLSPAISIYEDIRFFSDLRRRATVAKSPSPAKPDQIKAAKQSQGSRISDVVSQTVVLSLAAPDNRDYMRMGPAIDPTTETRVIDLASFLPESSSEPLDPAPPPPPPPPTPLRTALPKSLDASSVGQSQRPDTWSSTVQSKAQEVVAPAAQLKPQDVTSADQPRTRRPPVPVPRSASSSSTTSLSSEKSSSTFPRTLSSSWASPPSSSSPFPKTSPHSSSSTSLVSSSTSSSPSPSLSAAAAASSTKTGAVKDSQANGSGSPRLPSPTSLPSGSRSEEAMYVNILPDPARGSDPSLLSPPPIPPPLLQRVPRGPSLGASASSSTSSRPPQSSLVETRAAEEPARDRPGPTRRGSPPSPGRPSPQSPARPSPPAALAAAASSPIPCPPPADRAEDVYVDAGSGAPPLPPRVCGPPVVRVAPLVSSSSSSSVGEKRKAATAEIIRR